ncbi:MAG: hypothetical protein ABSG62_14290 [Terracidiphilus sp.]|jgi:hypothetical protein
MKRDSIKPSIFVLAVAAFALAVPSSQAAAQSAPGVISPRVNAQQRNLPGSVILRGEPHATTMQRLGVVKLHELSALRSNPQVTLGTAKLDFTPMLNNPRALFNVAQKLRALPQDVEVRTDETQVTEVQQGLVIHQLLDYQILPGKCNDPSARAQLEAAGVGCFQSVPISERIQAFSTLGSPRYVADAGKRQHAIAVYQEKVKQQDIEINGHIAELRKQLADPAKRRQFVAKFGAAEVDRVGRLDDDQIKGEMINSGEQRVEQTLFVPKLDNVARTPEIGAMKIAPDEQEVAHLRQLIPAPAAGGAALMNHPQAAGAALGPAVELKKSVKTDKDLGTYIYLTGFTLGKDYEWSLDWTKTINPCYFFSCSLTLEVDLYAGFSYGFGLRFPIQTHLDYQYTLHQDSSDSAGVVVDFVPINGSPDQYKAAGLGNDQIFDGKELVAQVMADAGMNYDLTGVGSDGIGVSIGKDFTEGLPAPFTNGQFAPPAPGTQDLNGAQIIFDDFDLLGGEGNYDVVGGQIFPAIDVGLHSDGLRFTLIDHVTGRQTSLTQSGGFTPIGVADDKARNVHVSLANPVYNLGFEITPGIDARVFVDLAVWSDYWDWTIWFPQVSVELPPGGVDFGCHAHTICSRDFYMQGKTVLDGPPLVIAQAPRGSLLTTAQVLNDLKSSGCKDTMANDVEHMMLCPTPETLAACKAKVQGHKEIGCGQGK